MKVKKNKNNEELNSAFRSFLPFQIDYTANYCKTFWRCFQKKYLNSEYTNDEYGILFMLNTFPDLTQAQLSKLLFRGKSHAGKILNSMESKGLIERVSIKHTIVTKNIVTEKGRRVLNELQEKTEIIRQTTKKNFSDNEVELFISFLEKYRKMLDKIVEVKLK